MRRACLATLVVASVLLAGAAQGQRGGGFGHGGAFRPGQPGIRSNVHFGLGRSHSRQLIDTGSILIPWPVYSAGYGETLAADITPNEVITAIPVRAQTLSENQSRRAPDTPAIPKLIEVPGTSDRNATKPQPATIFILVSSKRFEVHRYLLTANELRVTIDGQQRAIPLTMLDISATVIANHARGIELRIPLDNNEITLGF